MAKPKVLSEITKISPLDAEELGYVEGTTDYIQTQLNTKQATLVSGTNIKTINNQSVLGSGNIEVAGGAGVWGTITGTLSDQTDLNVALNQKELKSNKITALDALSTDEQYPSARCVYNGLAGKQASLPTAVSDRYLHTNSETGALEWSQVDLSAKEDVANKVISVSAQSTDTQYPSAKCVYDQLSSKSDAPVVITGTLTAGVTTLTLSSSAITTSSILDVYTDVYGVAPKTMVAAAGSVTMTFKAQASDLGVRLEVR